MTEAEKICANVSKDIRPQAVTLANTVLAMQAKIDEQIPVYEQMPLAQQVKVGKGEIMLRANPMTQEFRATVRDYASALKDLNTLIEEHPAEQTTNASVLSILRDQLKVAE